MRDPLLDTRLAVLRAVARLYENDLCREVQENGEENPDTVRAYQATVQEIRQLKGDR